MAEGKTIKLVNETMCETCIHQNEPDNIDPCHTCMETPVNENSKKPVNYISKEKK